MITTIHKSGEIKDPNNYRGITVTSAVGKVFNSILNNRLDSFLRKNKIINDCQIGFTKKARTSDHMFILKCICDKYCNTKDGRVYACFVDFQKAFDTVIHTGMKLKLLDIGVGTRFYNTIKQMYNTSQSCIKTSNGITDFIPVRLGVKQGDNLSPNLFKIFINDLPKLLENSMHPILLNNRSVNCLLYADDLILLSTSATGLQSKIDILDKYCQEWCLEVNTSKTKVLIFNKAGRHINERFVFRDKTIDCVSNYKYLELYFSASGSFSLAENELCKKASKAYYKLYKEVLSNNPDVGISIHLFDHTVVPILLYGCEVWGSFNSFSARFRNGNVPLNKMFTNMRCEKLHMKFCKSVLGVHKKATNFGVQSELGRFPLYFNMIKAMINFWFRLENNIAMFPILQDAFITSKQLFDKKTPSWYGSIQTILRACPEIKKLALSTRNVNNFRYKFTKLIKEIFLTLWKDELIRNSDGKLRTYVTFKSHFYREKYLSIVTNYEQRRSITKFRISCHKLKVETGRYCGIPCEERICTSCSLNEVEDEIHFLFRCPKYENERQNMLYTINKSCAPFDNLSVIDKLFWLMNSEDKDVLIAVGKFIVNNIH